MCSLVKRLHPAHRGAFQALQPLLHADLTRSLLNPDMLNQEGLSPGTTEVTKLALASLPS